MTVIFVYDDANVASERLASRPVRLVRAAAGSVRTRPFRRVRHGRFFIFWGGQSLIDAARGGLDHRDRLRRRRRRRRRPVAIRASAVLMRPLRPRVATGKSKERGRARGERGQRPAFVLARRHSAVRPLSRPPWQSCPSWATRSTSTKVHSLQRASETTHVDTPSTPWRLTCRPFTRSRPVRRQLGSTSHKRRVDGGEATTALTLVDEADTRPAAPRHHLQRCLPVPSRGLGI